ncbi:MAG: WbuC family cupin fold metalloprotein [Sedimentisphaerales bacterium]|nr:WbuC family cupin fold metalloprotein [Sedimentisphaerales bacterium]
MEPKPKTTTFFNNQDIISVGPEDLWKLRQAARNDAFGRARLCLHHGVDDAVHEMVIAFHKSSYIPPHRHFNKSESFHLIEGELLVVFFDDEGRETSRLRLAEPENNSHFLYRLAGSRWHTLIPMSDWVIIHETTPGPFRPEHTEIASWAPASEETQNVHAFISKLLSRKSVG